MPTPKITQYTEAVPPEKTSVVYQLELVVPAEAVSEVEDALDDFLECAINTVGRGELFNRQIVAHNINRAMQILGNRKAAK